MKIANENIEITVDPKELAHCRWCYDPMYIIKDNNLRWLCYQCTMEALIDQAKDIIGGK